MKKSLLIASLFAFAGIEMANAQSAVTPVMGITFDASGPVVECAETHTSAIYNASYASQTYDPLGKRYLGMTSNNSQGYYYFNYDATDVVGSAFSGNCTWEVLFRLDKYEGTSGSAGTSTGTAKIFSSQQTGGWSLYYYPHDGIRFQRVITTDGGVTNSGETLNPGFFLATGKFYHVVVTVNTVTSTAKMYVNGQEVGSLSLTGSPFLFPNIGTTKRTTAMWFNLGADPAGTLTYGENSNQTTFAFANIYNSALSASEVSDLYTADVKHYTEPTAPNCSDLLMDAFFKADGGVKDAVPNANVGLETRGTMTTQYNATQGRYEGVFAADNTNYVKRAYSYDPYFTNKLADAFSIECYVKNNSATWEGSTQSPISFQQSGGVGFELQNTGIIKFNMNTYGDQTGFLSEYTAQSRGTKHSLGTAEGALTTDYTHYVLVYDRVGAQPTTKMYINGVLAKQDVALDISAKKDGVTSTISVLMNSSECVAFSYAPWQWVAIGGDSKANVGGESDACDFPFDGSIAYARIWGKALGDADVATLNTEAATPSTTINIGTTGLATACLPFRALVPTGLTAYIVKTESANAVFLQELASAGQAIEYGTPVILKGTAGTDYTLSPAGADCVTGDATGNLLEGNYIPKDVKADAVYVMTSNATDEAVLALTSDITIPAKKAYLPYTAMGGGGSKSIVIEGPNSVDKVVSQEIQNDVYYNLQGCKVSKPERGIFILNGKKVFVK